MADSCVSSGQVFWKDTKRLANWGDHPHRPEGDRRECTIYRRIFLHSLPGKLCTDCLEKICHKIIEPNLMDI